MRFGLREGGLRVVLRTAGGKSLGDPLIDLEGLGWAPRGMKLT
jgi:hypothetical protein